jgi:excisionase family DNA binding protein
MTARIDDITAKYDGKSVSSDAGTDSCSLPKRIERIKRAMTAAEVAELLCVSPVTVYRMANAGQLPNFKVGTAVRFDPRAVADWLRGNLAA